MSLRRVLNSANAWLSALFKSLLNPTLRVGGLCEIQSKTAPHVNGLWKIVNIQYVGDSEGNDWFQTVECQRAKDYTVVK